MYNYTYISCIILCAPAGDKINILKLLSPCRGKPIKVRPPLFCINPDALRVYGLSKLPSSKGKRDVKTKIKCSPNQSPRTFSQSFPI